eukprot:10454713-Alexandrium_andersonii.AAC.1
MASCGRQDRIQRDRGGSRKQGPTREGKSHAEADACRMTRGDKEIRRCALWRRDAVSGVRQCALRR